MHHPQWRMPVLAVFLLGTFRTAAGQTGPADPGPPPQPAAAVERVLFIGSINGDCYADTVRGSATGVASGYLPRRICWGVPPPARDGVDDPACPGRTSPGAMPRQTVLAYAPELVRGGSVAFQHLTADSLIAMVIHMRLKAAPHGAAEHQGHDHDHDGPEEVRSVVVFGRPGLDSLPVMMISAIRGVQARPFVALELIPGADLVSPATRDLSGSISYILELPEHQLDERDSAGAQPMLLAHSPAAADNRHGTLRIYPNPAGSTLMVEATGLPDGACTITLRSVDGSVALRTEPERIGGGRLARMLDLRTVPSGYYLVCIEREEGDREGSGDRAAQPAATMSTSPIIITR